MRRFHLALLLSLSTLPPLAWSPPARAQVSDAERAAARDLFKQGDELQRAGKFPEALDKFQRAEQVIHAPTNILRIAECQAAMGRLVEAAESYRQVTHFQLSPTSPPAFQSAIDQAKGELAQVEPRVPKVTVQVTPPPAQGSQPELVIDGASVPFALVGEQIPLDPGTHTLQAKAAGYASQTETVSLKERDTKTVALKLEPAQGGATVVAPPPAGGGAPPPPPPPYGSTASPGTPPPPPPVVMESAPQAVRPRSNVGILIGAHLGAVATSGKIDTNTGTQNLNDLAAGGLGIGLDGGLRFARHWYVGVQYDHTTYSPSTTNNNQFNGYSSHSDTFGLDFAFIVNPDRVSFYGTLGLQTRIYTLAIPGLNTDTFTSGEFLAGAGIWIPLGHWFRLLPELTGGFGNFNVPTDATGTGEGHAFFTLGLVGYYNIDL